MKKRLYFISIFTILGILTGCGNTQKLESITEENTITEQEVSSEEITTEEVTTEKVIEDVVYNQAFEDSLKAYLEQYKTLVIRQEMYSSDTSGNKYNIIDYDITCDTKNKYIQTNITKTVDGVPDQTKYYFDDTKKDKHYFKVGTSDWTEEVGDILVLNLDIKDAKSSYDILDYLTKNNKIDEGVKATVSEDYYYFETSVDATEDMLSDVSYDKLGKKTITYIYQKDGDSYKPVSVSVVIDFMVGNTTYNVTSVIQINGLTNQELNVPITETTEEVTTEESEKEEKEETESSEGQEESGDGA